jgi:hypothetical protein
MGKTSGPTIDCLVTLQKMLDPCEPGALGGSGVNAKNQFVTNQRLDPIDQDRASLRDKAMYALQVLGLLELRCEISLRIAVSLIRVQRRLRTGANLASLVATSIVLASLAFGQPQVAILAAILTLVAIGVGMMSDYMIMTRKSDRVGLQTAHERPSQIVAQIQTARVELQTLLRHDLAAMGLGGAISKANALCAQIIKESAALITDPDGRAADDLPMPAPLQA